MSREHADAQLDGLLGPDVAALLTPEDRAFVWSRAGDPWEAAVEVCGLFGRRAAMTGGVTRWEADGVKIERTAADWAAAADMFRGRGGDGFAFLIVP